MGRIFETRKHTMFARWNKMAKVFTRISRDIAIAVKSVFFGEPLGFLRSELQLTGPLSHLVFQALLIFLNLSL